MLKKLSITVKKAKTTQYCDAVSMCGHNESTSCSRIPYRQPLGIVFFVGREERIERVVTGNDEAGQVGEQLAAEVEDDQEEVEGTDTDDAIGLGNARSPLDIVEHWVLGQLVYSLANLP